MRTGLEGTNHMFEAMEAVLVESKHENPMQDPRVRGLRGLG